MLELKEDILKEYFGTIIIPPTSQGSDYTK
jgi:hypothetical protein